jgi:hypothetical protein
MQLKPSDFLVWAALVSGGLIAMNKPKKFIGWFLIIASVIYFSIAIFSSNTEKPDSHNQTVTTSGNNSPVTFQSATTINNTTQDVSSNNAQAIMVLGFRSKTQGSPL